MIDGKLNASQPTSTRTSVWRQIVEVSLVFALAFLIRIINFRNDPITDELYHLLAASTWLSSGELMIADGYYSRAGLFTYLIAVVMSVTDGGVDAVRTFCVALGAMLVAVVFLGTRIIAGRGEAWVASMILSFMPGAIFLSQYIRFYSLHSILFWVAAIAIYAVFCTESPNKKKMPLLLVSALSIALAFQLQITTAIGLAGITVGIIAVHAVSIWSFICSRTRNPLSVVSASTAFLAVVGLGLLIGPLDYLLDIYFAAPLWSAGSRATYYAQLYRDQYGVLWALLPFAAIIAAFVKPRPAIFCIGIFLMAFVLQSFGGLKAERFNFYAMPFFTVIWGIAGVFVGRKFLQYTERALHSAGMLQTGRVSARSLSVAIFTCALAFAALATPATELTARMLAGKPVRLSNGELLYWSRHQASWSKAKQNLKTLVIENEVLITSQGLHALFYLGDFDAEINATRLSDFDWQADDDLDPRTGRPVLADSVGLARALACHQTALVVVHEQGWRNAAIVNDKTADWIEANLRRVALRGDWGLLAYSWKSAALSNEQDCAR